MSRKSRNLFRRKKNKKNVEPKFSLGSKQSQPYISLDCLCDLINRSGWGIWIGTFGTFGCVVCVSEVFLFAERTYKTNRKWFTRTAPLLYKELITGSKSSFCNRSITGSTSGINALNWPFSAATVVSKMNEAFATANDFPFCEKQTNKQIRRQWWWTLHGKNALPKDSTQWNRQRPYPGGWKLHSHIYTAESKKFCWCSNHPEEVQILGRIQTGISEICTERI